MESSFVHFPEETRGNLAQFSKAKPTYLQTLLLGFQQRGGMLVKKGQNNKIINLHDRTAIYTSRFVYIHQDSYKYIKLRIYTLSFVYIHQDSYIYSKIRIYTSRFVYIQQDSYIYIKIRIYTSRFVQFRHKLNYDRWIDYRVFKRRSKNDSKLGRHLLLVSP